MRKKISSWFLLVGLVLALAGCGAGGGGSADNPADGGADTTPPTVSSVSPTSGATSVAINSTIIATFSESVDGSTVDTSTFIVKDGSNNIVAGSVTSGSPTATFTPSSNLTANSTYTVTITTGVEDSAGNAMTAEYTWTFTTGTGADTTPPTVTSTSPIDSATGVSTSTTVTATFSEAMDSTTLTATTFTVKDAANQPVTGAVTYDSATKTATFTPSSNLADSTAYTATIISGVLDSAGNGMTLASTWTFTTGVTGTAPSAPTSLTVISATKTQVQLSWTASTSTDVTSYTVERASEGGTTFTSVATGVAATTYTDTTISQYTAYTYRVRAVNSAGNSNPSNEDKAGPPPTGFNVAVAKPASHGGYEFSSHVSMTLDENDDPMMAYIVTDLNQDTDRDSDSYLYFVRWDRANYTWSEPVAVDMVGQINNNQPHRQVSIARDGGTGAIGIAYQAEYDYTVVNQPNDNLGIKLAFSTDGGTTWTTERVDQISANCAVRGETNYCNNNSPALAMSDGKIHIAYTARGKLTADDLYWYYLVRYAMRTGTSGAFSETNAPWITGTEGRDLPVGLAIDSNGQPGLAYMVISTSDTYPYYNNSSVLFWHPGDASATKITDSNNAQNDYPSISLAFDGTKPRIAYHLMRDLDGDNEGFDEQYYLYFSASDDGVTWGSPVGMPFDGGHKTGWYQSMDTGSQGQTAIAAYLSSSSGDNQCGSPKLYRSSDNINWTVCGADTDDSKDADSHYVSLNFAGNDKLYLAFRQSGDNRNYGGFNAGLILWREP